MILMIFIPTLLFESGNPINMFSFQLLMARCEEVTF